MADFLVSVNLLLFKPGIYLNPCLESVLAQDYRNFEILIIDNGSGCGIPEKVREFFLEKEKQGIILPKWRLIVLEKNIGFSAGHNLGIKESGADLVFLVNQDIILDKGFLKNILSIFANDVKVGSIQGKTLRLKVEGEKLLKTNLIDSAGLVMLKNRRIIARGQGQTDKGQFEREEEIFGVDGAVPVYRRKALEDVKIEITNAGISEYFDEDFFAYKEDVDLAWRLRLYGWKAYYTPSVVAWHARTAGDSAARSYFGIIKERLKINGFAKYVAFRNQRLMQIKNEQFGLLLRHSVWFLPKEIGAWCFALIFERQTRKAVGDLFRQMPKAWVKRKAIMAKKRVGGKDLRKWFI